MERHIEWTSPAALWDDFAGRTNAAERRIFRTPAILRFASDSFIQTFVDVMQNDPRRMKEYLALPERRTENALEPEPPRRLAPLPAKLHRARLSVVRKLEARQGVVRSAGWNAGGERPLKLYQPAHERYYLVTACLVCRTLGLPDRPLNTSADERATFVLRMLLSPDGRVNPDPALCEELALVNGEWKPVGNPLSLAAGEEQHLLSPLTYVEGDGRRRRVFNGLIPVAKRESLVNAKRPRPPNEPERPPLDPRRMLLKAEVFGPWSSLEDVATLAQKQVSTTGDAPTAAQKQAALTRANEQIQTVAWYVLLDLSNWLQANLRDVFDAIGARSSAGLSGTKLAAYDMLGNRQWNGVTLREAVRRIRGFADQLESVKSVYRSGTASEWPSLKFQFVTAAEGGPEGLTGTPGRQQLEDALVAALDPPAAGTAVVVSAAARAASMTHSTPWFTVRCVFERPGCGILSPPVVSDGSAAFQLASFFDPEAPARPIRVALPADTTPAGLRKFEKNTAFVMSDVLCGQISAVRNLSFGDLILSVLPFPLHKDLSLGDQKPCAEGAGGPALGMVCSISIPIITLCALIVLMIMIKLLDIVFFWMPFFQICLPVPKFDAKTEA